MKNIHAPVLLKEIIKILDPQKNQNFVDCTLGDGGHSKAILQKTSPNGKILCFELNNNAIKRARNNLKEYKTRYKIIQTNFKNLNKVYDSYKNEFKVNGILMDLGISLYELKSKTTGISFQIDAPLDMRLDYEKQVLTAKQVINSYTEFELFKIFKEFGEEKFSRKIAKHIKEVRQKKKINTTFELVEIISEAVPRFYKRKRIHFATKIFQALRIVVNNELENLKKVLPQAIELLEKKGKLAVISFHSLEDRIVKHYFKQEAKDCICPKEILICNCTHKKQIKILTKKPIMPSKEEIELNPRARSAKLRIIERL